MFADGLRWKIRTRMRRVKDAFLACPTLHDPSTTIGELRRFFADDHVHMALLVEGSRLVTAVERQDLDGRADDVPGRDVGSLAGRTVAAGALLSVALESMRHTGRRRLAVTAEGGRLLGLLCRKANGRGFCSADDVESRRRSPSRTPAAA
jgi:hypothetical protein